MLVEIREHLADLRDRWLRVPRCLQAVLFVLIACGACSYLVEFYAMEFGEDLLNTDIPAEAQAPRAAYWWYMQGGGSVQISFRIKPTDLTSFINDSCLEPLQVNFNPFLYPYSYEEFKIAPTPQLAEESGNITQYRAHIWALLWGKWEPTNLNQYAGIAGICQSQSNDGTARLYYSIVADTSNPSLYTVYLEFHLPGSG